MKKINGFTLIELMLSLAILAMIASISILFLRHQIENARIQKTADEIESTMDAAKTFYHYTGNWPDNNFTQPNVDCVVVNPSGTIFIAKYLPNENYQDTFGGHYCWATSSDPAVQFWVAVKIPFINDATNTLNLAKQIAANIPDGAITSNPSLLTPDDCVNAESCYVKAAVTEGGNNNASNNHIVDVGVCSPSNGVNTLGSNHISSCSCNTQTGNYPTYCNVTFQCPPHSTGDLNATINNVYLPDSDPNQPPPVMSYLNTSVHCNPPDTTGLVSCQLNPIGKTMVGNYFGSNLKHSGWIAANYIALCIPINQTNQPTKWL